MSLIMGGVSISELTTLMVDDVDLQEATLHVKGEYPRQIKLTELCLEKLTAIIENKQPESPLWPESLDQQQFDQMMINMAHDAGLAYPEQFSLAALRHTYLTYLVGIGARLNDLEQVAGFVSPAQLGLYRQVNRRGDPVDIEHLDTQYPFDSQT